MTLHFESASGWTDKQRQPKIQALAIYEERFWNRSANFALAGNPAIGPLIFATVDNPALLSARNEIKNNFLAAIQLGSAVSFRCRQDQPLPRNNFVGPGFAQHLETAV